MRTGHYFLQKRLPERIIRRPRVCSCIEWDPECQQELLLLTQDDDACIFGDITQFFRDDLQPFIEELIHKPWEALDALTPIIQSGRAMKKTGWCLRHQKECTCVCAKKHRAGTSCTAFSSQGLKEGEQD